MKKIIIVFSLLILFTGIAFSREYDITLQKCIDLSVESNLPLKEAGKDVLFAEAQLKKATAGFYPGVSATTNVSTRNYVPQIDAIPGKTLEIMDKSQYELTFRVKYLLYDGGGISSLKSQQEAQLESAKIKEEKTKQDVIYKSSLLYFHTIKTEKILLVSQDSVKVSKDLVMIAEKRYGAGTVALADVLKAKSQLADAEVALVKAKNSFNISLATLNDYMGLPLNTSIKFRDTYNYVKPEIIPEECEKKSLENRLEIDVMKKSRESAYYAIEFAKSSWYPDLFFSVDYTALSNSFFTTNNTVVATLGAQFNIFDGFKTSADVESAEATYDKVGIQMEDLEKRIKLEVARSCIDLDSASEKYQKTEENLKASRESFRVAEISYREGITPYIDVNQAQLMLTTSEINQVQALFDFYVAKLELLRVMGLIGKEEIK